MQCIGMSSLERFTQQTPNHMPRLDCPSVSAETSTIMPNPKPDIHPRKPHTDKTSVASYALSTAIPYLGKQYHG